MIALYDACVLYPAPLRDLLMQLATTEMFRAKWTNRIHDEWMRNLLVNRPDLSAEQLERTRTLMNSHILDCLVEDYHNLESELELPDSDDRHVLAAAIKSKASVIVTFNLRDFPKETLARWGIRTEHPDAFLSKLYNSDSIAFISAIATCRARLKHPPMTSDAYLDCLSRQGLSEIVATLRKHEGCF